MAREKLVREEVCLPPVTREAALTELLVEFFARNNPIPGDVRIVERGKITINPGETKEVKFSVPNGMVFFWQSWAGSSEVDSLWVEVVDDQIKAQFEAPVQTLQDWAQTFTPVEKVRKFAAIRIKNNGTSVKTYTIQFRGWLRVAPAGETRIS